MQRLFYISLLLILVTFSCSKDEDINYAGLETLSYKNKTRHYKLYLPESYSATSKIPVLLNFHGYGGQANDFFNETRVKSVSDAEEFISIYPQGLLLEGYSHWNAGLDTPDNKSDVDDFGFIEALIEKIKSEYSIDEKRIYAVGFSNGGMFAYALGCFKSDLIAGVGAVSGSMLIETRTQCNPTHPTSVLNIHGTNDGVLPYNGGTGLSSIDQTLDYWNNFNNTDIPPQKEQLTSKGKQIEHVSFLNGINGTSVEHYKIKLGGHEWQNLDIDGKSTVEIMWNFLSKYDINGEI